MKSTLHTLSIAGLLICYLFLLVVVVWIFYPYRIVEYRINPIPVLNPKVKAGDTLYLRMNFCKFMSVESHIIVSIEDHVILNMPDFYSDTLPGCYDRTASIVIPSIMVPGEKARIHYSILYQVNPIRQVEYDIYSQVFTIVK